MKLPTIWLGDAQSYQQVVKAYEWGLEHPDYRPPGFTFQSQDPEEEEESLVEYLAFQQIEKYGNVGVLSVDGPLVNDESFWNAIFGLVSYNTIATALNMLLDDEEVTEIIMNFATPGGDSQGVEGLSTNIEGAKNIKPITAWSGEGALSAGYWLAASTGRISGARMAEFGSIGVVTTATSYAKMLKEDGIEVEVIRAGKYKAPVHPAEPISGQGKAILEEKTNQLYDFFLQHVARNRTLDISNKDKWAEGKVFFAEQAIPVGLVDEVATLNELVSRLTVVSETTGDDSMSTKVILSEQSRAQLASGAPLKDLEHQTVDQDSADTGDTGLTDTPSAGGAEQGTEATDDSTAEAQPETQGSELTQYLQSQLSQSQTQLVEQRAENVKLTTRATELEKQNTALMEIAIEATHRLQVALGQTPVNLSEMPPATVISYYGSCKEQFDQTFKPGRTSLDADQVSKESADAAARALGITPVAE